MADQTTTKPETDVQPTPAPAFDPATRATELAILDALRTVVDPEIGMNVVELALIKQVILGKDQTEIKMRRRPKRSSSTTSRSPCWPSGGIRATPA